MTRRRDRLRPGAIDRGTWYVLALAAVLFVAFSLYLFQLYRAFQFHATDLGRYTHMMATTLEGRGIFRTGVYRVFIPTGSYWGRHFTLTLGLFLPVFALAPSAVTLLVAKSVAVAASIPLLWIVARKHVADRVAGLLVVSYAFNPFLWSAWSFEFQEQVLVPVIALLSYHAYVTERYRRFLLVFALGLLTNEHMILISLGFLAGLTVDAYREGRLSREWRPLSVGFGMAATAEVLAKYAISQFSIRSGFAKHRLSPPLLKYVEGPTAGTGELLLAVVRHPRVLPEVLAHDSGVKLTFFVLLLAPAGFVAVLEPVAVGAMAPWLGFAWVFGGGGSSYMFRAHYPYYLLPFLYIGTARFLDRFDVPSRLPVGMPSGRHLAVALVAVLAVNAAVGSAMGWGNMQDVETVGDHERTLKTALEAVPEDASLVTQNRVHPHVATRPNATAVLAPGNFYRYQIRYGNVTPEYVLYDTNLSTWEPVRAAFSDRLGTEYGLYRYEDGIFVWKRGYEGQPRAITSNATNHPPRQEAVVPSGTARLRGDPVSTRRGPVSG